MSFTLIDIQYINDLRFYLNTLDRNPEEGLDALKKGIRFGTVIAPPGVKQILRGIGNVTVQAGEQGVKNVKDGIKRLEQATQEAGMPGSPVSVNTPPGFERQPTIIVTDNGRTFTQGPDKLVPIGGALPPSRPFYIDADGIQIFPPSEGWARGGLTGNGGERDDPAKRPEASTQQNDLFNRGTNWRQPSDPLILDLDGDGIELTTASNTVLFDHNKDNIKTGTQWVRPDDGILVRDLNNNGLIDSGRELFGDQTYLPQGFGSALSSGGSNSGGGTLGTGLGGPQLATNGWQALAALDSNRDGIINASDAAFAELKVWRDLNQDGISQANELQTLSQAGVSSINLGPNAAAGTQVTGSYTTTDGTTRTAQNIDFATNNFYSEFTDNPAVTATAAGLPQLQGAGFVRDMREAMSLGTAQSQTLAQTITSFKTATTTQARQALLDQVITAWANTSSLGDAKARNPLPTAALLSASNGGGWYVGSPAQAIADFAQSQPALYAQLSALERFNGQPVIERYTRATNASYYDATTGTYKGYTFYTVSIEPQRLPFFQTAYDSLKASTYQSLYLQTEGKQLLGGRRKQRDQYSNYYKNRSCLRTNLLGYSPTLYLKPRVVRAPCMDVAKQPRLTQSLIGILGSTHTDLHAMHSF